MFFSRRRFRIALAVVTAASCLPLAPDLLRAKPEPRKVRTVSLPSTPRSAWGRFAGKKVRSLKFVGTKRTRVYRLRHFFDTRPGRVFKPNVFREDMRRIRNLELFQKIRVRIVERNDGLHITIHLKDKWSLLPYFNFVRGGGSYQLVMGVYDVNVLGHLFMLDLMAIVFDGKPAGVVYAHVPRIGGIPLDGWVSGGWAKSIRSVYGPRTAIQHIYLTDARWVDLTARTEPVPWFRGSLWQRFMWRAYELAKASPLNLVPPPRGGRIFETGLTVSFGTVKYRNYMMHGIRLDVSISGAFSALGTDAEMRYMKAAWNFRAYYRFGPRGGNLAGRLAGGYISGGSLEDEFTLGSFAGLRGFQYAQFLGRAYVVGNFEYRTGLLPMEFPVVAKIHKVFRGKTLRIQGVVFTDVGAIAGSRELDRSFPATAGQSIFGHFESGKLLWSIGAGARFSFVPFYKATLRIDAAYTLSPFRTWDFIIATQQYF